MHRNSRSVIGAPICGADALQSIGAPERPDEHSPGQDEYVRPQRLPLGHRDRARYAKQRDGPGADATEADKRGEHAQADRTATGGDDLFPFLHMLMSSISALSWLRPTWLRPTASSGIQFSSTSG